MSTSLLYHGFGVRGYRYLKTKYVGGEIIIVAEPTSKLYRCAVCGSEKVWGQGGTWRRFRTLPLGSKAVHLVVWVPRVECRECRTVRQIAIGFARPRRTYTKSFERYVLELSRQMTIKAVAEHLNVSWDIVKDIQKRYLYKRFARPKLKHLRQIAIDEISTGKGHKYVTQTVSASMWEMWIHTGKQGARGQGSGARKFAH